MAEAIEKPGTPCATPKGCNWLITTTTARRHDDGLGSNGGPSRRLRHGSAYGLRRAARTGQTTGRPKQPTLRTLSALPLPSLEMPPISPNEPFMIMIKIKYFFPKHPEALSHGRPKWGRTYSRTRAVGRFGPRFWGSCRPRRSRRSSNAGAKLCGPRFRCASRAAAGPRWSLLPGIGSPCPYANLQAGVFIAVLRGFFSAVSIAVAGAIWLPREREIARERESGGAGLGNWRDPRVKSLEPWEAKRSYATATPHTGTPGHRWWTARWSRYHNCK